MDFSALNQTLTSVNRVLSGQQELSVNATISNTDLLKVGSTVFVAMLLAVILANLITNR